MLGASPLAVIPLASGPAGGVVTGTIAVTEAVDAVVMEGFAYLPLITDTDILKLPVNVVLHGNQRLNWRRTSVLGTRVGPIETRGRIQHSAPGRISEAKPSFTVTTSKKGFD